jgi:hypothetical protein
MRHDEISASHRLTQGRPDASNESPAPLPPLWLRLPWILLALILVGVATVALAMFWWEAPVQLSHLLSLHAWIYLGLLLVSLGVAHFLQPRWRAKSGQELADLYQHYGDQLSRYDELRNRARPPGTRRPPFDELDKKLDRLLDELDKKLDRLLTEYCKLKAGLFPNCSIAPCHFDLYRDWSVLLLHNLLMPLAYHRVNIHIQNFDCWLDDIEHILVDGEKCREHIQNAHVPVLGSLESFETDLDSAIDKLENLLGHIPLGIKAIRNTIKRSKDICWQYKEHPDDVIGWSSLEYAFASRDDLEQKLRMIDNYVTSVVSAISALKSLKDAIDQRPAPPPIPEDISPVSLLVNSNWSINTEEFTAFLDQINGEVFKVTSEMKGIEDCERVSNELRCLVKKINEHLTTLEQKQQWLNQLREIDTERVRLDDELRREENIGSGLLRSAIGWDDCHVRIENSITEAVKKLCGSGSEWRSLSSSLEGIKKELNECRAKLGETLGLWKDIVQQIEDTQVAINGFETECEQKLDEAQRMAVDEFKGRVDRWVNDLNGIRSRFKEGSPRGYKGRKEELDNLLGEIETQKRLLEQKRKLADLVTEQHKHASELDKKIKDEIEKRSRLQTLLREIRGRLAKVQNTLTVYHRELMKQETWLKEVSKDKIEKIQRDLERMETYLIGIIGIDDKLQEQKTNAQGACAKLENQMEDARNHDACCLTDLEDQLTNLRACLQGTQEKIDEIYKLTLKYARERERSCIDDFNSRPLLIMPENILAF